MPFSSSAMSACNWSTAMDDALSKEIRSLGKDSTWGYFAYNEFTDAVSHSQSYWRKVRPSALQLFKAQVKICEELRHAEYICQTVSTQHNLCHSHWSLTTN